MADINFKYAPLNSGSQEIRILSISGSRSIEVECSLEHASLMGDSPYDALSYTWGDLSDTSSIKLNQQLFPVTKNLAIALQHLREEKKTVKIWIDAVCINQKDNAERSVQVRRMKEIYEKAKSVIIWLGHEADDSSYAMKAMNSIDRRWVTRTPQPAKEHRIEARAIDERALRAISQLLCRPWWRRVWIIQEATCANNTYLRCGKEKTEFLAVVATVNFITQHTIQQALQQDFNSPDIIRFHRVITLDQLRLTRRRSGRDSDFLSLLDNSRTCEASDPRDKIFALSGLATDTQREAGKPDYCISVDKAYIRFVNAIIESERTLNILGHCQEAVRNPQSWSSFKILPSEFVPKRTLPSWTPDWTLELEATPFMKNEIPNEIFSNKVYKASDNYPPSVQLAEDLRTLFVRGSAFDSVSNLGEAFTCPFSSSIIGLWHSWIETELGSTYHKKETTHEAFLHTLVADIGIVKGRCVRGFAAPWPIQNKLDTEDSFTSSSLIKLALNSRGFFLSKQGYMGVARYDVTEGDRICILHGGQVPFILRQEGTYHLFKGECYVHGLMDGEGMKYPKVWQDFALR
jgi:Heterokaryon incompatibility protein (HET)